MAEQEQKIQEILTDISKSTPHTFRGHMNALLAEKPTNVQIAQKELVDQYLLYSAENNDLFELLKLQVMKNMAHNGHDKATHLQPIIDIPHKQWKDMQIQASMIMNLG